MWFSVRGQKGSDLDQTRSSLIALNIHVTLGFIVIYYLNFHTNFGSLYCTQCMNKEL